MMPSAPRSGQGADRFGDPAAPRSGQGAANLAAEARRLDDAARRHKGEIARHRRALQDVRARQAEVERQCRSLGITVTYHHHGEGHFHGQSRQVPRTHP